MFIGYTIPAHVAYSYTLWYKVNYQYCVEIKIIIIWEMFPRSVVLAQKFDVGKLGK